MELTLSYLKNEKKEHQECLDIKNLLELGGFKVDIYQNGSSNNSFNVKCRIIKDGKSSQEDTHIPQRLVKNILQVIEKSINEITYKAVGLSGLKFIKKCDEYVKKNPTMKDKVEAMFKEEDK